MDPARRAFYQFHASIMEPWDGPASIAFTDGTLIGAVLDRNGLRPSRYWVTDDGLVVMASEVGVLDIDPARVVQRGRLQPGRMFLVDTAQGRIVADEEIKSTLAAEHPYTDWLADKQIHFDDLPPRFTLTPQHASIVAHQRLFGYTTEDLKMLLAPMAKDGIEPLGLDGHRHARRRALGSAPPAVRLLPAAVRPGHQPASRRHPRGAGHLPVEHHRPRAQPARARTGQLQPDRHAAAGPHQRGAGEAAVHQRGRHAAGMAILRHRRLVPGRRRRPGRGAPGRARRHLHQGQRGDRGRRQGDRPLGPAHVARAGTDPRAAPRQRGPSPS